MSNYQFDFQKFSIIQRHSAMKVGTDGVLLGAWSAQKFEEHLSLSNSQNPIKILDIGTGTGLIALMLAQRFSNAEIIAIEIDHESAEEAKLNVGNSIWKERINVIEMSLQEYGNLLSNNVDSEIKKYSLIVTNPPFYNASLKPENGARATARHCDSLPFKDITSFCDKYLCENGLLAVIYPTNVEENIMEGITFSNLKYHTICDVFTKEGKPSKRRMIMLSNAEHQTLTNETLYIRDKENNYSEAYKSLTKDYYLP